MNPKDLKPKALEIALSLVNAYPTILDDHTEAGKRITAFFDLVSMVERMTTSALGTFEEGLGSF